MVHIAGAGIISGIGHNYEQCFSSLANSTHGIKPLSKIQSRFTGSLPVGEVMLDNDAISLEVGAQPGLPRTALLGIHAATEAVRSCTLKHPGWRKGFVSGTTVGGMDRSEIFFRSFLNDRKSGHLNDIVHHGCGSISNLIAQHVGFTDFVSTINTACSSSVNAIIYATKLIRNGLVDIALAGGTDALTKFTINGFRSLMILDEDLCKPFDANRAGLNLGEGAGYVLLVSEKVMKYEALNSRGVIAGFGNTNDAYHQTASSPEGRGSYLAMKQALTTASLDADEISYINLHGTGTVNNDLSESAAIIRLFQDKVPALSSTKTFTGHTLGACGGIEAVFSLMALEHQCIFPNLRFGEAIHETGLKPQQHFAIQSVKHVMSNSFGFGGNCSSIIISQNSNSQ